MTGGSVMQPVMAWCWRSALLAAIIALWAATHARGGREARRARDRQLRLSRRAGAGQSAQRRRGRGGGPEAPRLRDHGRPRRRSRGDGEGHRGVRDRGRGCRRRALLLCRPRHAASGRELPHADRRQPAERRRPAPPDQAQRHRRRREARKDAAHHDPRCLPRQSARWTCWKARRPPAASRSARSVGLAKLSRTAGGGDPGAAAPSRGGDIIVYAAEAGRTAADGVGRNSPFSAAFVRNVETEGQEVVALMRRVATERAAGDQRRAAARAVARGPVRVLLQARTAAAAADRAAAAAQRQAARDRRHRVPGRRDRRAASEQDRAQIRRELMALVSEMVSRSGLKPDQLATELPKAFARLAKMRKEIEEFRRLMENEPGIAPFVEIAAAAVASGRKPDLQAADQALAQAQARYDEAIRARTEALERTRGKRAALSEQRGNIAETEYRSKEAAEFYLAAAKDTPDGRPRERRAAVRARRRRAVRPRQEFLRQRRAARGDPHPRERGPAALRADRADERRAQAPRRGLHGDRARQHRRRADRASAAGCRATTAPR